MALIRFGGGVVDARGSVSGNVFTKTKAGATLRSRRMPIRRKTNSQILRRSVASRATHAWGATLTAAQRAAWDLYALNTGWTNKLGESINIGGLGAFVRLNGILGIFDSALHAPAPTAYGHASSTLAVISAVPEATDIVLAEPSIGWDKDLQDDQLLIFQNLPQSPGKAAMPKRPLYLEILTGADALPVEFPYDVSVLSGYPLVDGERVSLSFIHIDPEFRVSTRTTMFCTVATP